jgi:hypothetical protein
MFAKDHRHRSLSLLVIAVSTAALIGCGGSTPQRDAPAGTRVELRGVSYDVEFSSQLNPDSDSDHPFFAGVPAAGRKLPPDQVWLGVFVQAQNESDGPRRAARSITVADTVDHAFRPVRLPPENDYAYRPATLAPGDSEPAPESPAASSPEEGSLLLFHLPLDYFMENRPLELRVSDHGQVASVQLDV